MPERASIYERTQIGKEANAAYTAICGPVSTPKTDKKASVKPTTFTDRWYEGVKVVATALR